MIKVENISKQFKTDFWAKPFWALENLSFEIKSNELVGFLGANGAGKTTLLKIIMGFIKPTSGEIKFNEALGSGRREVFKNVGFLPERPYFYPHLTGREFLDYMSSLHGIGSEEFNKNFVYWTERLKIDHAVDRKINSYSKGMLQRLGFASAILHNPQIIILDEPLSGLDPVGRKEFKDILTSLHKKGKTIFFSSHIVSDVEEICHNVVILESGELVFEGEVDQLIAKNIKPNFHIKFKGEINNSEVKKYFNEDTNTIDVPIDEKEKVLKSLIEENVIITSVLQDRPSLETIIYNIE